MQPDQTPISITINIYPGRSGAPVVQAVSSSQVSTEGFLESMPQLETKADDELSMDYSGCSGFDQNFMNIRTPFPEPGPQLKRKLATIGGASNQYMLKYYHFSTMHHSVRRVPVVSAINIDGNPVKRRDTAARKDKWIRDNRIDFDLQLNDQYYKGSHFDKGHMSRREDANWDSTPDKALRDADLTCIYTNAVPQVPEINRAIYGYHGLWGQLEQIVLEKGAENETGDTTKICVYNGPIFVDTDPVFRGVQTALRFYKIIVWKNGAGQPKTTAFILSQEDLVGGIQFEELQFDQEFKEHQCSVAFLENLTGLTFTKVRDWDTYQGQGQPELVARLDQTQLESLITQNNTKK